jgi:hypothetical protein
MFKKDRRRKSYRFYRRGKRKKFGFWARLGSKFLWVSIVFLTILILIYAFSFYQKLSQPEAKEQKNPVLVRVQILNGCSNSAVPRGEDVALKLAKRLEQLSAGSIGKVNNMVYEIVEIEKCDFGSIGVEDSLAKESLILDRLGDEKNSSPSEVALLTAQALGISRQNVITKKLKNNYQDVSLTIWIGDDYKILFPALSQKPAI